MTVDFSGRFRTYLTAIPRFKEAQLLALDNISEGWECDVYSFGLRLPAAPDNEEYILRIYPGQDVPFLPDKHIREYQAMQQLFRDGFPVPETLLLESDPTVLGAPFMIMKKIKGDSLGKLLQMQSANAPNLLNQFCSLFARLHDLNWRSYVQDVSLYKGTDTAPREIDRLRTLAAYGKVDDCLIGLDWLEAASRDIEFHGLSVVHWDFHPNNVLVDESGQPFVIDWTCVDVTDFRFDLAWSLLLLGNMAGVVRTGYEKAKGTAIDDLDFFLAFACWRRLGTMAISLEQGAEMLGMRPGTESIIRRNLRHISDVYSTWLRITGKEQPYFERLLA